MTTDLARLLSEGQKAHSKAEYVMALGLYQRALQCAQQNGLNDQNNVDALSTLDLRIGTHVKMKNIDLARKDAKLMIRIQRSDPRGYLRCGQLDRLGQNYAAAIKWYDQGLKNVPKNDMLYDYIKVQHQKTNDLFISNMKFTKPVDPAAILPAEIFQMVVSYLDYRQTVAVLRVSKRWSSILSSLRPLIDTLDFSNTRRRVTYQMLRASLRRLSKWPKTIIVDNLAVAAATHLADHLGRWVNHHTLEHLEVSMHGEKFTTLPFHRYNLHTILFAADSFISMQQVRAILNSCKQLRSAKFKSVKLDVSPNIPDWNLSCPNLRTLHLCTADQRVPHVLPVGFFQDFPGLTNLACSGFDIGRESELWDLSHLQNLQILSIGSSTVRAECRFPRSLRAFHSKLVCFAPSTNDASGGPQDQQALSNLRVVTLDRCNRLPGPLRVAHSLDHTGVITNLTFNTDDWSTYEFFTLLENNDVFCKKVATLDLTSQVLKDAHLDMFKRNMPLLESLKLCNAGITGVFLLGLLKTPGSRLSKIILNQCHRVSPDTVEWARKRKVSIELRNSTSAAEGLHRIRDHD